MAHKLQHVTIVISPQTLRGLVEAIHQAFPVVAISPVPPYEDEDFTLVVRIPAGMDREEVMNTCIQHALKVEDEFGFTLLTRVKEAAVEKAVS